MVPPRDPSFPLGTGIVFSILAEEDGTVWFGTGQGLFHYEPAKETFTQFDTGLFDTGGGVDNRIFKVFRDRQQRLWVITTRTWACSNPGPAGSCTIGMTPDRSTRRTSRFPRHPRRPGRSALAGHADRTGRV